MGDLLHFKPSQRQTSNALSPRRLATAQEVQITFVDQAGKETGRDSIKIQVELRLEAHLSTVHGTRSQAVMATTHLNLKDYTLEELRGIAERSSLNDWTARASYFQALLDEIKSRLSAT